MFVQSGAVGDDPLILVELQTCWVDLDLTEWNGNRTLDMLRFIGLWSSHIDKDCCTTIKRSLGLIQWDARNIGVRERKFGRCSSRRFDHRSECRRSRRNNHGGCKLRCLRRRDEVTCQDSKKQNGY